MAVSPLGFGAAPIGFVFLVAAIRLVPEAIERLRDVFVKKKELAGLIQRAERFYMEALNARWPQFAAWLAGSLLLLNGRCVKLPRRSLKRQAAK